MSSAASVGGRDSLRLFCGLRLPDDVLDVVERWQAAELARGRVVTRANLHVTLAFLGGRPRGELPGIVRELAAAAARVHDPIRFSVRGYRETRSVGMLVLDDADGLAAALAGDLHERLERLGVYERERRAWLPHVTVLRFREPARLRPSLPDPGTFSPSDAAVYHSVLRPTGAQYEALESFALGG